MDASANIENLLAATAPSRSTAGLGKLASLGLMLCIAAFWMLEHPYEGIVHDSVLYAFQALARLHPQSLGHDIYLTLGTQDRYTLFSPLAAAAMRAVGVERAAEILTFAAQMGFFLSAWLLARRLMSPALALLSLGLLVVLPSVYGDRHIFSYVETYMTARMPAEALALAGLWAAFGRRHVLGAGLLVASMLLHPLMGMAAVVLLFILLVGRRRPGLATGLVAAGFAALVGIAWAVPLGPVTRFSAGWWHLMYSRGDYLFPSRWLWLDWAHVSIPLATLAISSWTAVQAEIRALSRAALLIGAGGLALAWVGGDLLHIVLIVQGQPWRWLWLSNTLAVLLLPVIASERWRSGDPGRIVLVLLAAGWVCIDQSYAPLIGILSVVAAIGAPRLQDPQHARLLLYVSCAILAIGLLALLGSVVNELRRLPQTPPDPMLYDSSYLLALRRWQPSLSEGIAPACVVLLIWWVAQRYQQSVGPAAGLGLGIALCAAGAHFCWNAWTRVEYPSRVHEEFASWRAAIPPRSQVLWFTEPFGVWYLLERPSYWSDQQMAASVFSEELTRRLALRELILHTQHSTGDPRADLSLICKNNPALGFFVSPVNMGPTPFPPVALDTAETLRLYRCAER